MKRLTSTPKVVQWETAVELFNDREFAAALDLFEKLNGFGHVADRPLLLYYMATSLREQNKHKQSIKRYEEAIEELKKNPESDLEEVFLLSEFALCLVREGETARSKVIYEQALELDPKNVITLSGLAACHLLSGNLIEAKRLIEESFSIDNSYYHTYHVNGMLLDEESKYNEAIEMYTKASTLNPLYARSHYNKALCYEKLYRVDSAITEYRECIHLDPLHTASYQNLCYCYYQTGDKESALKLLNELLEKNIDPDALSDVSDSLREIGEDGVAMKILNQTISLDPTTSNHYIRRANLYKYLEQTDLSIADYQKALELDPENENLRLIFRNTRLGPKRHTLIVCGDDRVCQLGNVSSRDEENLVRKPLSLSACKDRIRKAYVGIVFSVFWMEESGTAIQIVENGILNPEDYSVFDDCVLPKSITEIKQIACGVNHFLLLTNDGIYGKGENNQNELSSKNETQFQIIKLQTEHSSEEIEAIACGPFVSSYITKAGDFYWTDGLKQPKLFNKVFSGVKLASFSDIYAMIWTKDRTLYKISRADSISTCLSLPRDEDIVKISSGNNFSLLLTSQGNLFGYNVTAKGIEPTENEVRLIPSSSFSPPLFSPIKDIATGETHADAIRQSVWAIRNGL